MISTRRALHPVAIAVLDSLYQHRVLTTAQIHELHAPEWQRRGIQQLLSEGRGGTGLLERGLVSYVQHRKGGRDQALGALRVWFLTEQGAEVVEAAGGRLERDRRLVAREAAAGVLQRHTLAVNDMGLAWVRAARKRGDECGPLSWRHEVAHALAAPQQGRRTEYLIADAVLRYSLVSEDDVREERRFIELDRGTEVLGHLADQLRQYAKLKEYEAGRPDRLYRAFPSVVVVLTGGEFGQREQRMKLVTKLLGSTVEDVEISFVMLEDLIQAGPFERCFYPASNLHRLTDWLGND